MKSIISLIEGPKLVESAMDGSARAVPRDVTRAKSPKPVKLSAEEWDRERLVTVDAIHARAETVTSVLESILHCQPMLPFNNR